jgi:hypothetical protein
MQLWQFFPLLIIAGVVVYVIRQRGRMAGQGADLYGGGIAKLRADFAADRRPDESEPACVVAVLRKTVRVGVYFVGVTNQRLLLKEFGGGVRKYERSLVSLEMRPRVWVDGGNTQITRSEGWELTLSLPGGEQHVLRVYQSLSSYPDQERAVPELLKARSAAAA